MRTLLVLLVQLGRMSQPKVAAGLAVVVCASQVHSDDDALMKPLPEWDEVSICGGCKGRVCASWNRLGSERGGQQAALTGTWALRER